LYQVGTSSLLIYMMHGHTYIKFFRCSFTNRSAVRMVSISPSKAFECCPSGI